MSDVVHINNCNSGGLYNFRSVGANTKMGEQRPAWV